MVVVITSTSGRHQPLLDLLFLARKLVLLLLVGYVICYIVSWELFSSHPQTGLLRGSVKVKEA
jgi:hypothetical protein